MRATDITKQENYDTTAETHLNANVRICYCFSPETFGAFSNQQIFNEMSEQIDLDASAFVFPPMQSKSSSETVQSMSYLKGSPTALNTRTWCSFWQVESRKLNTNHSFRVVPNH